MDSQLAVFRLATLAVWAAVVLLVLVLRGRAFATFAGILLGVYSLSAVALVASFGDPIWLFATFSFLHILVFANIALLTRPRMRSTWFRFLLSWPAALFLSGVLFGLPWAVATALGFDHPTLVWLPFVFALIGLLQSSWAREEVVHLTLGGDSPNQDILVKRAKTGGAETRRALRIVQITDPHLGPFMSVEKLRAIAERAVARAPDLIVLTGDFLTMESRVDPEPLRRALEPLQKFKGRVFACRGNHDHEAPRLVAQALAANGIRLLIDECETVETEAGPVQIVGMDFTWRGRAEHMERVCRENPRQSGAMRLILLHDPGAFKHLGIGEGDLVLSGHTHGGQVGLVSLGLNWTVLSSLARGLPDHGFWRRGTDRLYVHRGTGHYGFPIRLGVPAERSLLVVHSPVAG